MATETEVLMLRLEANMKKYEAAIARAQGQTNRAFSAIEARGRQMEQSLAGLGRSALAFGASIGVAFSAGSVASGVFETALQFERIDKAMLAATGSASAARAEMDFVKATANRLGLELGSTAQQYAFLAAAARGTSLEGQKIRDIFTGVATASATLGLTAADTAGVLNAVQQMISKGVVSAEELRGQMGERLPGAFQAAARAMGMTTQELGKALETGKVMADDLLPKLAAELLKTGDAAGNNGLAAEVNRLSNAWTEFKINIGNSGVIAGASSLLEGLNQRIQDVAIGLEMIADKRARLEREGRNLQSGLQLGSWRDLGGSGRTVGYLEDGMMTDRVRSTLSGGRDAALNWLGSKAPKSAPPMISPPLGAANGRGGGGFARRGGGGGGGGRGRAGGQSAAGALREIIDLSEKADMSLAATQKRALDLAMDYVDDRARINSAGMADALQADADRIADAYRDMGDIATDVFDALVEGGGRVEDVMKGILKQLASSALRSLFGGPAGLAGSFDTVFGNLFGRAGGGPVNARQPYLVGETGPELFIPRGPGRISRAGGGNSTTAITIDLRGTTGDKELDRKFMLAVKTAVAISKKDAAANFGPMLQHHSMRFG